MNDVLARREEYEKALAEKNISIPFFNETLDKYADILERNRTIEKLHAEINELSESFRAAPSDERKQWIRKESNRISGELEKFEHGTDEAKDYRETWLPRLEDLKWRLPNIPSPDAPKGVGDEDNVVVRQVGEPRKFGFSPLSHYDILLNNDWADFERISKVCGARAYCLKGAAARLEIAMHAFVMDKLADNGFTMISVPPLLNTDRPLLNSGHFPYSRDDVYKLAHEEGGAEKVDNLWLSGTAEIVLTSLHQDEILAESDLPVKYAGYSACFRREAGAAGRDTRGLFRVHSFAKTEQFVICRADIAESDRWHAKLLSIAEEMLADFELPYRVVANSTGDMGAGKYKMNDIETWMPSENKYRETHSCSSLSDWQARRANIRYRENGTNKVKFCYTLNNTAIATPRIMAQFLENHQVSDGRVRLPEKLRPYMSGREFL
jgi:seryl-tRNA synthetase